MEDLIRVFPPLQPCKKILNPTHPFVPLINNRNGHEPLCPIRENHPTCPLPHDSPQPIKTPQSFKRLIAETTRHSSLLISSFLQVSVHATTHVSSTTTVIFYYPNGKTLFKLFASPYIIPHHIHEYHHPWPPVLKSLYFHIPSAIHLI